MKAQKVLLISISTLMLVAAISSYFYFTNPLRKAKALELKGRDKEAVSLLDKAVTKDPSYALGWRELGFIYKNMKKPRWALQCFQKYVRLNPEDTAMSDWVDKYQKTVGERYSKATVQIVEATISPAREDGSMWNGNGMLPSTVLSEISKLLVKGTWQMQAAAVATEIGSVVLRPNQKPAPYGAAIPAINGEFKKDLAKPIGSVKVHTLTPLFGGAVFENLPLNDGTRIRVALFNGHTSFFGVKHHHVKKGQTSPNISNLDSIGEAEINSDDIENAMDSKKIYQVKVADQTQNQILFIGIEARAAGN